MPSVSAESSEEMKILHDILNPFPYCRQIVRVKAIRVGLDQQSYLEQASVAETHVVIAMWQHDDLHSSVSRFPAGSLVGPDGLNRIDLLVGRPKWLNGSTIAPDPSTLCRNILLIVYRTPT